MGREFGSGGREIGRRIAEELQIAYYDQEIITEIAKRTALSEAYIRQIKLPFQDIQDMGRKEELYLPLMENTYIQFIRTTKNMLLVK